MVKVFLPRCLCFFLPAERSLNIRQQAGEVDPMSPQKPKFLISFKRNKALYLGPFLTIYVLVNVATVLMLWNKSRDWFLLHYWWRVLFDSKQENLLGSPNFWTEPYPYRINGYLPTVPIKHQLYKCTCRHTIHDPIRYRQHRHVNSHSLSLVGVHKPELRSE